MKPRFTMPHVAYRPSEGEIFRAGRFAGEMTQRPGTKCDRRLLCHHLPLFKQEPISAQLDALEIFKEGYDSAKRR